MLALARLRPRRRIPYWLVAGAIALTTALLVGRVAGAAAAERALWGELRTALVTRGPVAAGTPLAGHVQTRQLPATAVPRGALPALPDDAVTAVDLAAGEIVLEARLTGGGRSTVAARLPDGTRGVAVPTGDGLPVELGDRVDVLATFEGTTNSEPTITVAADALVVAVGKDSVTVAVSTSAASRVAYALTTGAVTLVLSG